MDKSEQKEYLLWYVAWRRNHWNNKFRSLQTKTATKIGS